MLLRYSRVDAAVMPLEALRRAERVKGAHARVACQREMGGKRWGCHAQGQHVAALAGK